MASQFTLTRLLKGASTLAQAVAPAYGPHGHSVIIETVDGRSIKTRSGLAIAETMRLKDVAENTAAGLMVQAARKTEEDAGGGASTTILLAEAMLRESINPILNGADPSKVRQGLLLASKAISNYLNHLSKSCSDETTITRIATVATNGDAKLGQLLAHAFVKTRDTVVLEKGTTLDDESIITQGFQFESDCIDEYFTRGKTQIELESPYIALVDTIISNPNSLTALLRAVAQFSRPLLMIVTDIETQSLMGLMMLLASNRRSAPKLVIVKPLVIGEQRHYWLEGLTTLIGGSVISNNAGLSIESAGLNVLGTARGVWVTRKHTSLIGGGGSKRVIGDKVVKLRREIEKAPSQHEKDGLGQSLAVLTSSVALIRLGGATNLEIKQRKVLAESALALTRACDEGVLPGGGAGLLLGCNVIRNSQDQDPSQAIGIQAVLRAAEKPLRQIVENAGGTPEVVVNRIARNNDGHYGYNAATGEFGDMMEMGILDPTRTIRCALENAVSAASLIMNMVESTYESSMQELGMNN
jgi:chaperonin GroEL